MRKNRVGCFIVLAVVFALFAVWVLTSCAPPTPLVVQQVPVTSDSGGVVLASNSDCAWVKMPSPKIALDTYACQTNAGGQVCFMAVSVDNEVAIACK